MHDFLIKVGCPHQIAKTPSQINLNQSDRLANVDLKTTQPVKLWMNYFTHMVIQLQRILQRLTMIKNPWGSNEPIEMLFKQIEVAQNFAACAILDMTYLASSFIHKFTLQLQVFFCNEIHDFYCQQNTNEFDWPMFKNVGPLLGSNKRIPNALHDPQPIP